MSLSEEGKQGATPPAAPVPSTGAAAPVELISIEEFRRVALRVGVVVSAQDHPNADRLLVLSVDIGEGAPRQLVAGIKGSYQAAELIGKRVVVVANLKPATLRGVESHGMVLAASDGPAIAVLGVERPVPAGSPIK